MFTWNKVSPTGISLSTQPEASVWKRPKNLCFCKGRKANEKSGKKEKKKQERKEKAYFLNPCHVEGSTNLAYHMSNSRIGRYKYSMNLIVY